MKPSAPEPTIEYLQERITEGVDCTNYMNQRVREGWVKDQYQVYTSRGGDLEPVYRDFIWMRAVPTSDDPADIGAMKMT